MEPTTHCPLNRAIIRIAGDDRQKFLQGVITQDLDPLAKNAGMFSCLLTPQGKIRFDFHLYNGGEFYFIDIDQAAAAAFTKALTLYRLRADVTIELVDDLNVTAAWDDQPSTRLQSGADRWVFADSRIAALGWRIIEKDVVENDPAMSDAYLWRRIQLGVPEFSHDLDTARADFGSDEMFLMDVNYDAINGVSYKKGCFVGQEVTSRMKRKGDVRKRTMIARFDGPALARNTDLLAGASSVGTIMSSVAFSGEAIANPDRSNTSAIALAFVRLDRIAKARENNVPIFCGDQQVHLTLPDYLTDL